MIISRTPFRISLFGGGTDYPAWFRHNGGAVIGTSIDKYCYISVRHLPQFFTYRHRFVYSKVETVSDLGEIQHPAIRAVLQENGTQKGLEIHHDGDLPARSGLGSSSSFTVGLIHALRALEGKMSSSRFLGDEAIRIEQQVIGESVGSQDQVWAAYGGTNHIAFFPDGRFEVTPILMTQDRRKALQSHIMLFFTGFSRIASQIAEKKISNLLQRENQLMGLARMVNQALDILQSENGDVRDLGRMLHEAWQLKKQLADNVSTSDIDGIYQTGMDAGALGGKLLGAGGGGFMLFFVEPDKREAVRRALGSLVEVNVNIGSPGSQIVVYEPDLDQFP